MNNEVFKGRDLLAMDDLTGEELLHVLEVSAAQKRMWATGIRKAPLAGKAVAIVMQKPSLRTRVSFEVACVRLGVHPVVMGGDDSVFSRGESVHDTALVLERMVDAVVVRTYEQQRVEELAVHARIPVVNALTDDHHPCQGLADLLTIRERFGSLAGLKLAYVGDGNNMANTYLLAGALTGMRVVVASPPDYAPSSDIVDRATIHAARYGGRVSVVRDPAVAVAGADVVITDTWASMGQESQQEERRAVFEPYRVDGNLFAQASPEAIFMHCLPAHRGEEVTDEVIDHPRSMVFDEAENRLHVQKALLSLLLG
jgi:ornithine carbamoyltransferase